MTDERVTSLVEAARPRLGTPPDETWERIMPDLVGHAMREAEYRGFPHDSAWIIWRASEAYKLAMYPPVPFWRSSSA